VDQSCHESVRYLVVRRKDLSSVSRAASLKMVVGVAHSAARAKTAPQIPSSVTLLTTLLEEWDEGVGVEIVRHNQCTEL
jgi:hypothetical protein